MKCEHCEKAPATETIKIRRREDGDTVTIHLCESCMKKITEDGIPGLRGETPTATVAISQSDDCLRIEIRAPLPPPSNFLTKEEFASAVLSFVAEQIARETSEKRGKDN